MNKNKNKKLIGILIILATVAVLGLVLVQKFTPPEEPVLSVVSEKRDFKVDEDTEFQFKYIKDDRELVGSIQEALNLSDYWEDIDIIAELEDSKGKKVDISSEISLEENGEFSVKFKKPQVLKPGVYKMLVKIEDESGESTKVQELEQEFSWGVLAINANKSIYLPDETAYLQMAALDSEGHTICDANLRLEIRNPLNFEGITRSGATGSQSETTVLSTEDGTIQYSDKCGLKSVTDKPDYSAYYQIGEVGKYQITLTNLAAVYKITDSFEVRESVPFDVERIGPTRIYPPATYEMKIRVGVNQDFEGDIIETVPERFRIVNQELSLIHNPSFLIQNQENGAKSLVWQDITLKEGDEFEIIYSFDAPDISPYLYLLGPLIFSQ